MVLSLCIGLLKFCLERKYSLVSFLSGWLISNSKLLSPSDKLPYVLAVESLRGYSGSHLFPLKQNGAADDDNNEGVGDFICHADRKLSGDDSSENHSNEEGTSCRYKKNYYAIHITFSLYRNGFIVLPLNTTAYPSS